MLTLALITLSQWCRASSASMPGRSRPRNHLCQHGSELLSQQLNDSNGNRILQNVTGTYSFWVDENIVYYVSHHKFLGGYFMPYIAVNIANASLVADINGTNLGASGGGSGLADTYVQPLNLDGTSSALTST